MRVKGIKTVSLSRGKGKPSHKFGASKTKRKRLIRIGFAVIVLVALVGFEEYTHLITNTAYWLLDVTTPEVLVMMVIIFSLLLWKLPKYQVSKFALSDKDRFDRENEARKTLATILGGLFLLAGLYSSIKTLDLTGQGQITDRYTRAIEQLGESDANGNPKYEVRLGAIYALGRISRDSTEYGFQITRVLSSYIKIHAPASNVGVGCYRGEKPTEDIQAALSVLGRRMPGNFIDLRSTNLSGANFSFLDFTLASFQGANLSGVQFENADVSNADFGGSDLDAADLSTTVLFLGQLDKAFGSDRTRLPEGYRRPPGWGNRQCEARR
jgi:hypothetical protein